MKVSRREFLRDGVTAFTVSFAAPAFLSDIALAQGVRSRNLGVLYLSGGNDSLSTVVPYKDPFYYSRRPAIAIPADRHFAHQSRIERPDMPTNGAIASLDLPSDNS